MAATFQGRIMARSPFYITATAGTPSAFGTVTCASVLAADTVTVNGLLYTAVAGVKADDTEFSIDTSDTACALDLADSITNDTRTGTLNDVTATSSISLVIIFQTVAGTGGDATTLVSSNGTRLAVSGATFSGGGDGTIESAELEVYVWEGTQASQPASATYTISKDAMTSTDADITFEISDLIRDYFIHNGDAYNVTPDNYADALWVETILSVVQEGTNPSDINNIYIAFDGYGFFTDGVNPSTTYDGDYDITPIIRVETFTPPRMPFYVSTEANDGVWKLETFLNAVLKETIDYSTQGASVNSYDRLAYYESSNTIDTIKLHYTSTKSFDIAVEYIDECKYDPKVIGFINKEGLLQRITMFKLSKESISTKRDSYISPIGGTSGSAYTYDVTDHMMKDYNITATEDITLNSGFVGDNENIVFKQLLLSERVWVDTVPVKIRTSNLDYKTRTNDKLINYTLRFEYSNDVINYV